MPAFITQALTTDTWAAFAELVERHNGGWGGCWCVGFHPEGRQRGVVRRELKERKVREGSTHAALVFVSGRCVGWCQFGSPPELPRIKHLRVYTEGLEGLPDWRITCFFVDKEHRGQGFASAALAGAAEQITRLGGGTVESYPEDVADRKVSGSFLYNSRLAKFEHQGFQRFRRLGKNHWVVSKAVTASAE